MSKEFGTVEKITQYVKPRVDQFRQFPSRIDSIVEDLQVIFSTESVYLSKIVKDQSFSETFLKKMGKGRMRALKKILYRIDREYYKQIDFKDV